MNTSQQESSGGKSRPTAPDPVPGRSRWSQAHQVRALLSRVRHGALSTHATEPAGYPFGSIVNFAVDAEGHPLLLTSNLAQHTRNFLRDPRAALTVAEFTDGDPLAVGRVSLIGDLEPVSNQDLETVRSTFLDRHPEARRYVDFSGFCFYRLRVRATRYVGGFGEKIDDAPTGK